MLKVTQTKLCTVLEIRVEFYVRGIQWNLCLSFLDNSFSQIRHSGSLVPERILFQLWFPHLLFYQIHCFFFRLPTKTMNRGFTVPYFSIQLYLDLWLPDSWFHYINTLALWICGLMTSNLNFRHMQCCNAVVAQIFS
jgi:hypothetical protein